MPFPMVTIIELSDPFYMTKIRHIRHNSSRVDVVAGPTSVRVTHTPLTRAEMMQRDTAARGRRRRDAQLSVNRMISATLQAKLQEAREVRPVDEAQPTRTESPSRTTEEVREEGEYGRKLDL